MRYTWIDGQYVQVSGCGNCPFVDAGDGGFGEFCRYPHNPSKMAVTDDVGCWSDCKDNVPDDCPLKVVE